MQNKICNPNWQLCKSVAKQANGVSNANIPLYWGGLGIFLSVMGSLSFTQVGVSAGGFGLASLGWTLMWWYNNLTWGPNFLFWLIHIIVPKNVQITYLFVLFSNLTLLGPIIMYWLILVLVLVAFAVNGGANALWTIICFFELLFTYLVVSIFQFAWIL